MPSLALQIVQVSLETLTTTVKAIKDEHKKLTQELNEMEKHYEEVALDKLRKLKVDTAEHAQKLEVYLAECTESLVAVTKFFGEDPRKTSPSDFFATLNRFLNLYNEAVNKITSNPKKYPGVIREQPKRKLEEERRARTDSHLPDEEDAPGD